MLLALGKLLRLKPSAVIGFGGYPSVPVMLAAVIARLPTAIIEQNAVVGRANRLVMNQVRRVAAAFPIARFAPKDRSKIVLTGNPLRPEVIALWGAPYASRRRGWSAASSGVWRQPGRARLERDRARRAHAIVRWAEDPGCPSSSNAGPKTWRRCARCMPRADIRAELKPFFHDMPQRMAEAQLVIGRSGAGTVAELMAIGRPAILVPLPHALDDNQTPNAEILSRAGAGWTVAQRDLSADALAEMLTEIFAAPSDLGARAGRAHALAIPGATEKLADMVEQLSEQRSAA